VVANSLGFERPPESAVALEGNIPCPEGPPAWARGRVILQLGVMPGGYAWIFPKGDHITVGVGGWKAIAGPRLRPALARVCRDYGLDSGAITNLRGHHLPIGRAGAPLTTGGAALIGDAAALLDPLSGEGIYAAIASGTWVAPAIDDYLAGREPSLAPYERAMAREVVRDTAASRALMDIFHAWPDPWVWLLQHSDRFWRRFCEVVRGDDGYDHLVHSFGPAILALAPMAQASRAWTSRQLGDAR
jgi:flavin-dependent dehydrogenase